MNFNYTYHRARLHIPIIDNFPVGGGDWMTVNDAAKKLGVSKQYIRILYLLNKNKNDLTVCYYRKKKRPLFVNVNNLRKK